MPARNLPARPDVKQLKHQAKDLLRAFRRGEPSAIADFHPQGVDAATAQLSDAQLVLARSCASISWPRLAAACDLIDAVRLEEFDRLRTLAARHPEVLIGTDDRAGWSEPNVTPLGWGRAFHDQGYVSQAAMRLIAERGGTE